MTSYFSPFTPLNWNLAVQVARIIAYDVIGNMKAKLTWHIEWFFKFSFQDINSIAFDMYVAGSNGKCLCRTLLLLFTGQLDIITSQEVKTAFLEDCPSSTTGDLPGLSLHQLQHNINPAKPQLYMPYMKSYQIWSIF